VNRACAGILILCLGCAEPQPAKAPSPERPPDPFAAELVENLLNPPMVQPSREQMEAIKARTCADPASACELYEALRNGRAVIQEDPPARADETPPRR
jgi:hypothetical protein